MAKGFKVKTVAPKQKGPEWDIDAIKERMKGKKISWETQRVPATETIAFHSPRSGELPCVQRTVDGSTWIEMDFPAQPAESATALA